MSEYQITNQQARKFILSHQGLWPPYELEGKGGILDYINKVGCIQFDPLNIVGFNQELVLQSRVKDFQPVLLQELLYEERKLVDAWDKNMSIYPVEDWPYFERNRQAARNSRRARQTLGVLDQVREQIERRGPLTSSDLDLEETVDWAWAPTRLSRAVLESMYFWGELIVHHKIHTRKTYDFAHRHIPDVLLVAPDPNPTEAEYHDWYALRRIGSVGLLWNRASDAWLEISKFKSKERNAAFERLMGAGKIVEVEVEDLPYPLYLRDKDQAAFERILDNGESAPQAAILAPLDNLLWDRRLIEALFGFQYRWEVYKPVEERQYGYYVLPVLYGDRFVARFEPGKDKKSNTMLIKNWWWEPDVELSDALLARLRECFQRFTRVMGFDALRLEPEAVQQNDLAWLNG